MGYQGDETEVEDMVDLWHVWLPGHKLILTLANDYVEGCSPVVGEKGVEEALRTQKWVGPDGGPYDILGYLTVPGNCLPKGPVQNIFPLSEHFNQAYRKLIRTLENFKENIVYPKGSAGDAEAIQAANHLDMVGVSQPNDIKSVMVGGQSMQPILGITLQIKKLIDEMAGGLSVMGGLAPQSDTARQDEMLNQNSSKTLVDFQQKTVRHAASVLEKMCWYWHHHPTNVMQSQYSVPGVTDISIDRKVTPEQREQIPWADLCVKVDPYSMQPSTPQSRLNDLVKTITTLFMPLAQQAMAAGVAIDFNKLFQKVGELGDQPDLQEVLTYQEPMQDEAIGESHQKSMPNQTSRNYTRRSIPQERDSDSDTVMRLLGGHDMGGSPSKNGVA